MTIAPPNRARYIVLVLNRSVYLVILIVLTWLTSNPNFMVNYVSHTNLVGGNWYPTEGNDDNLAIIDSGQAAMVGKDTLQTIGLLTLPLTNKTVAERGLYKLNIQAKPISKPDQYRLSLAEQQLFIAFGPPKEYSGYAPTLLFAANSNGRQHHYIIEKPPKVSTITIGWNAITNNAWSVSVISMHEVERNPTYVIIVSILSAAWLMLFLSVATKVVGSITFRDSTILLSICVIVGFCVVASKPLIIELLFGFYLFLPNVFDVITHDSIQTWTKYAFKIGHALAFFIGTATILTLRKSIDWSVSSITSHAVLIAVATEAMQRHLLTRSSHWQDVLLDITGILLALLLIVWLPNLLGYLKSSRLFKTL